MSRNHQVSVEDFLSSPIFEVPLASSTGNGKWKKLYALVNISSNGIQFQVDSKTEGLSFIWLSDAVDHYNSLGE